MMLCTNASDIMNVCAAVSTVSPATGNTESSTYVVVLVIAGVLIAACVVAGILGKKKK